MAINVQKFLPQSKTSAIVRANVASSLANRESDPNRIAALSKQYNEENVNLIRKPLFDIDTLVKSLLTNDQQSERNERLKKQRKQREEVETKLEAPKEKKKFNLPTISIPGTSFLDRIKRFLFFTALGFLFNTFQSQLPKLKRIFVTIGKVYNVAETIFKFILESMVNFIDRSYQLYDKVRETVKIIGGEKAQKIFDELSANLNKYINYVLIGGLALTGAIEAFATNVRSYKPPTPRPSPGVGGRPGVTTSGGRPAGELEIRNPLRQRPTITTSGGEVLSGAAKREAGKGFLKLIKGRLAGAPLIGGLIEFGISWALGDPVGKAAFRGVGSTLVGALGAVIGSFPPLIPFGGPAIGLFLGGWAGAELGAKLYEVLFENKKPSQPVQRQQSGGRVLNIRGYAAGGQVVGRAGRTLRVQKKTIANIIPQTTQPGKDVGGEKEIQRLYPDSVEPKEGNPWLTAILGRATGTITNPFRTLERIADTFKQIPFGIGALMGGAIDAALGQKMSEGTLNSIATGLEGLFENINSKNYNFYESMFGKKSEVPTMAVGGTVERTGGIVQEADFNPKKLITPYIESTVGQVIEIVRKELSLGKEKPKEEKKPTDQTDLATRSAPPSTGAPSGTDVGGMSVGYVGSTGRSSGPHIHIETGDGYSGKGGSIPASVLDNIIVDGKPLSSYSQGDGLGAGRGHQGFDYPIRNGAPITLKGGLKFVEYDDGYNAGYGNSLIISDSSGRKYLIGHLSGGPSNPEKIKELAGKQEAQQQPPLDQTQGAKISPDTGKPGPIPSGGTLNFKQLVDVAKQAGFTGQNAIIAAAIARGESSGNSSIVNDNRNTGDLSYGLWQINMIDELGPERRRQFGISSNDQLKDPLTNAKAAFLLSGGSNFNPWSVYKSGAYRQYLSEAKNLYKGGLLTPSSDLYIQNQSPKDKASSLTKYPSYSPEGEKKMAVLPIIQERFVPVPIPMGGNKLTSFRVSGGVNNNTNKGLMRG